MTTVALRSTSPRTVNADAVVVGLHADGSTLVPATGSAAVVEAFGKGFVSSLATIGAKASVGDVCKLPSNGAIRAPLVVTVGLGAETDMTTETLRRGAGAAARSLAGKRTVAFALPAESNEQIEAVATGSLLGAYAYDEYLTTKHEPIGEVVVLSDSGRSAAARRILSDAAIICSAVNYTRDLVNRPPNVLYPETFADDVRTRARGSGVRVSVLDERSLSAKGYGGIMGVGQGSARPPRLVTLTYRPPKPVAHLAFVGKGITFDSGGLSIKPSNSMGTMKSDMSGAAAVVAATIAIAELGIPVRVSSYACLAENMPSGKATRPGDVLSMYGGKTVEVLNTDAEGRLVLADGITTANAVKPDVIVDVATLTGACVVALGAKISGVLGNSDDLVDEIVSLGSKVGENLWPLPIPEEMNEKIRTTKVADLSQHNPDPWGGALFAAAFLREFVGNGIDWAHLDIAGPAFNEGGPTGYTPKGGTGAAVRTLIALAQERARR